MPRVRRMRKSQAGASPSCRDGTVMPSLRPLSRQSVSGPHRAVLSSKLRRIPVVGTALVAPGWQLELASDFRKSAPAPLAPDRQFANADCSVLLSMSRSFHCKASISSAPVVALLRSHAEATAWNSNHTLESIGPAGQLTQQHSASRSLASPEGERCPAILCDNVRSRITLI